MTAARLSPSRFGLTLALAAALGACASAPAVRYYTLQAPVPSPAPDRGLLIQVLPVQVPAQVDVPELVIRQGEGEVARAESEQWIAPLHTELRAALSLHLQHKLGARDVQGLPQASAGTVPRVRVVVTRFEAYLDHRVDVEAGWTLGTLDAPAQLTCSSRIRETVTSGYPALVAGYQRALARLGDDIAAAMGAMAAGAPAACPAPR